MGNCFFTYAKSSQEPAPDGDLGLSTWLLACGVLAMSLVGPAPAANGRWAAPLSAAGTEGTLDVPQAAVTTDLSGMAGFLWPAACWFFCGTWAGAGCAWA